MEERIEHYRRIYLSNLSPAGNTIHIGEIMPGNDDRTLEWLEHNCFHRTWNQLKGPGQIASFFLNPRFEITTWYSPYVDFDRRQIYVERHIQIAFPQTEQKIPQNLADFLDKEKFEKVKD